MRRLTINICALGMALGMTTGVTAQAPSSSQAPSDAPSASELLARIDGNQAFTSIEYSARMEIRIGKQLRVKSMKAWALSDKKAFIEFTNPEDYGTRMLKLEKELWMYFPKEQDTIRISGHLLKEGLMGSDLSYEDALESDELSNMYQASITREAKVDDRRTFVVELKAKTPQAKYDRRVLWVDAERFVVLSEEMYARSGRLLKTSSVKKVERIDGRWYATVVVLEDKLRKDSSTTIIMDSLRLDVPLSADLFTRAALER